MKRGIGHLERLLWLTAPSLDSFDWQIGCFSPVLRWTHLVLSLLEHFSWSLVEIGRLSGILWLIQFENLKFFRRWRCFLVVSHRSFDTQNMMQKKCYLTALSLSLCREFLDHIFLHCLVAWQCWICLFKDFGIDTCLPRSVNEWLFEAINGWPLKGKGKILWRFVVGATLLGYFLNWTWVSYSFYFWNSQRPFCSPLFERWNPKEVWSFCLISFAWENQHLGSHSEVFPCVFGVAMVCFVHGRF